MKINRLVNCALLILALSHLSFQWPVEKGILTSSFGESRGDHFHDGIDLVCPDDKIYPSQNGKLVYMWDRSLFPEENYPGGGNYKILAHGDMFTIYMHLQDGTAQKRICNSEDVLGIIGNSGHSFAKHLHFSILNRKNKQSINPLQEMPSYNDKKAPKIFKLYIRVDDTYYSIDRKSKVRLTKHYPLLIEIKDSVTGKERLGIYDLHVMFNDTDVLDLTFKNLDFSNKGLLVENKVFDAVFDEAGYYKVDNITYRQGRNNVLVRARDYNGNMAEKVFHFDVNLDLEQ